MLIQVHTDNHIVGREQVLSDVEASVRATLDRVSGHLTRVDVYLSDENGPKSTGDDIRCQVEARPDDGTPLSASHRAGDMDEAVDGALDKLLRLVTERRERLHDPKGRTPMGGVPLGEGGSGGKSQGRQNAGD